jgi:hypothetical protein
VLKSAEKYVFAMLQTPRYFNIFLKKIKKIMRKKQIFLNGLIPGSFEEGLDVFGRCIRGHSASAGKYYAFGIRQ